MKTYIIHLMRHGMTEGNKSGRYVGSTDVSLSTDGINELKDLAKKYDYKKPQLIFSSPMKRCIETIEHIYGDCDVYTVDELKECNLGEFEGKTANELINDPRYMDWVQHGSTPPGGESNKDFATRVCTAFVDTVREILKSGKTESIICAHGGVIMTVLAVYGLPQRNMTEYMANNGRGFTIRVTPGVWMRTGMFEVVSDFPFGSAVEPDNSINPVKNSDKNPFENISEDDLDDESNDVFWADVEENEKDKSEEQ